MKLITNFNKTKNIFMNCYASKSKADVLNNIKIKDTDLLFRIEREGYKNIFTKYFNPPSNIIDIGSGWGRYSLILALLGHNPVLLDSSKAQIEGAKAYLHNIYNKKNIKIIHGNITKKTKFKSKYFDHAICLGSVLSCSDYKKILLETGRILKKDGLLIASVEDTDSINKRLQMLKLPLTIKEIFQKNGLILCPNSSDNKFRRCFLKTFSVSEAEKILCKFGFKLQDTFNLADMLSVLISNADLKNKIKAEFYHQIVLISRKI